MLKVILTIVVIGALAWGGFEIYERWIEVKAQSKEKPAQTVPTVSDTSLPGMPSSLESALDVARNSGAVGLKNFLVRYGKSIRDPRLASIELEYVVLVAPRDVAEAKKTFARVKARTPANSPVYPRVQELEKTYE